MKKYFYILLVAIISVSCNDFLDKNPDSRADLESPENISALLVSAYPSYSHVWFTEVMSDNATDIGPEAGAEDEAFEQAYYWEKVDDEYQDSPDGYWYSCYSAIAAANTALESIDALEEEGYYTSADLDPLRGEALICRAYAHFMLVNLFAEHYNPETAESDAGIPYITEVETEPIVEYTRQSVEYVYSAIEKDFLEGYELISDDAYDAPKWHFNKQAAAAFISRYYLYRGLDSDWDKVISYANDALEDNPDAYLRDWLTTSEQSTDVFGTNYSKSEQPANFLIQSKVSSGCRAWYYRYSMDLSLLRKRVVSGSPHPTKTSITNDYVLINKAGGSTTIGCYGVFKFTEEFKSDAINADYGVPYVMYTTIVAEESLFNLIEGYVMKEDYDKVRSLLDLYYSTRVIDYDADKHEVTEAKIISQYTDNSNSPDINPHFELTEKQKIYLKCIVNIRASEFVAEGQRWFDIKRMHMEIEHETYGGGSEILTSDDSRRVISIPEDASTLISDTENSYQTFAKANDDFTLTAYTSLYDDDDN